MFKQYQPARYRWRIRNAYTRLHACQPYAHDHRRRRSGCGYKFRTYNHTVGRFRHNWYRIQLSTLLRPGLHHQESLGMLRGFIFWWFGELAAIPYGWAKCDGTNGTPDLQNRGIIGAGGDLAVGATGTGVTHTHNIDSANHNHILSTWTSITSGDEAYSQYTSSANVTGSAASGGLRPPFYFLWPIMQIL
jgi:hypothetical protein